MSKADGFYTYNLDICYCNIDNIGNLNFDKYDERHRNSAYRIIWQISDNTIISVNSRQIMLQAGFIRLILPSEKMYISLKQSQKTEFIVIAIHPSFAENKDELFRSFISIDVFDNTIDLSAKNCSLINELLQSILRCIFASAGKVHVVPRVTTLLSELVFYCNGIIEKRAELTENISVRVMKYIDMNYTTNISYFDVCQKFFISKGTIRKIVFHKTGQSFWNYITKKRMEDAENLLIHGQFSLNKIALLCGYNDYSSFYRNYVKTFGKAPKNDKLKSHVTWPLSCE